MSSAVIEQRQLTHFDEVETLVPGEYESDISNSDVEIQVLSPSHVLNQRFQNVSPKKQKQKRHQSKGITTKDNASSIRFFIWGVTVLGVVIFGGASLYLSYSDGQSSVKQTSLVANAQVPSFQPVAEPGEAIGYSFSIDQSQSVAPNCEPSAQSAVQQQVLKNVAAVIQATGLSSLQVSCFSLSGQTKPAVRVVGYLDDRQYWMRVKGSLLQSETHLGMIVDHVASPAVRKTQIDQWLDEAGISSNVNTYLAQQGLVAELNIDTKGVQIWNEISKRYMEKFANNPQLYVVKDPRDMLQIHRISFGESPKIITKDGSIYEPGETLGNGYSIVSIQESGIKLKNKDGIYTYALSQD